MTSDLSKLNEPRLDRSVRLNFTGDWGQANFHRICSWLCQEVCDRTEKGSRVAIWNLIAGADSPIAVSNGEVDLCIATPVQMLPGALTGEGVFEGNPLPRLRALAVLPQTDRMVFAIDPKFGVSTFEELREKKPPITLATSEDDGTNLIGYTAARYLEAHGIDQATLESWGGKLITDTRPEQSVFRMRDGEVDALLQEAYMTPWWRDAVANRSLVFLPAEDAALDALETKFGWPRAVIPANFWEGQTEDMPALNFSDFAVLVRDDMPEDLAHLLTWCLVETREVIEQQFRHIPAHHSPLSYPIVPERMANSPIPLHPGAARYYKEAGVTG
ncbi:TAXI family TRAP transporter solute-binding subunit [Shimia sediminis]|uniref:TAXI family TRAP transporter solute-binding subunit n=1 Tax=Shimia sediminis TaxID=2497945 RepID=UPI000F8D4968|nr:TAXI family TRAP transporter solute-binding subunit [Shimia sediminis]